jgi:protein ImuA
MLQTRHAPVADTLALAPEVVLARARAHELTGPARVVMALTVAARTTGPVIWLQPAWGAERLMGDGIRGFLDPGRIVFGRGRKAIDLLWAAEQALMSGRAPLVVAELPTPPELTPVRRLHLAAETGAGIGAAPLALLLTPDPGGAPGVESRWRLAPAPGWARDGSPRWRLDRLRARLAPEASWEMRLERGEMRLETAGPCWAGTVTPSRPDPESGHGAAEGQG